MTKTNLLTPSIGAIVTMDLDRKKTDRAYGQSTLIGIYGGSDSNGVLFGLVDNLSEYFKLKAMAHHSPEDADALESAIKTVYIPWRAIVTIHLNM